MTALDTSGQMKLLEVLERHPLEAVYGRYDCPQGRCPGFSDKAMMPCQ